ncbi:MAG: arylsulfatase, partial [Verrucomicrobiales bacterium]|nr:arylsulfatase [Verrucomicrobiales bacterium]
MKSLLILLVAILLAPSVYAAERPNIILIMMDDLGYSDLGCFGGEISTPHIDSLSDDGLRLTQLYNSARCCPTRASLLTGLYPHQTGVGFMAADNGKPGYRGYLNDQCVTTAQLLQKQGYKTYLSGKWHLRGHGDPECIPTNRGFDEFFGPFRDYASFYRQDIYYRLPEGRETLKSDKPFYATGAITDHALHFLDEAREEQKPSYLYLAYNAPHFPLQAPVDLIDKYTDLYEKGWDEIRSARARRIARLGLLPDDFILTERGIVPEVHDRNQDSAYFGRQIPAWDSLSFDRRKDLARRMATYAAMVEIVDRNIGRLLANLKAHDELERTCIFLLSDNGACAEWDPYGFDNNPYPTNKLYKGRELRGIGQPGTFHSYGTGWANACNTPFQSYKHYTYEGGISTPMIIHFPQLVEGKGKILHHPRHVMDIAATILDLAEVTYPGTWDGKEIHPIEGRSLVPLMKGSPGESRPLFFEHEGNRGVRDGQWKLVWSNYDPSWRLFDLETDRTEVHDISHDHPEKVRELSEMWHRWAERCQVEDAKVPQP